MLRHRLLVALAIMAAALMLTGQPTLAAVGSGPRTMASCDQFVEIADISQWQPNVDFRAYATQRPAVIIKSSEGRGYKDPYFDRHAWDAAANGVAVGAYHFAQPSIGDARAEADFFVSVAHGAMGPGSLPPALDLEANPYGMSGGQLDAWALEFLNEVRSASGRQPIIYTGAYFAHGNFGNDPALAEFGLWIAAYNANYQVAPNPCLERYPAVPNAWGQRGWDAWQYTSCATTAGVPRTGGGCGDGGSGLDMSVVPPNVLAEWLGTSTVVPNAPPDQPAPADPSRIVYDTGSRGPKVAQIQTIVGVNADGRYGPQTKAAVARWQRFLGIRSDGVWGPATDDATSSFFAALAALANRRPVVKFREGPNQDICDAQSLLADNGFDFTGDLYTCTMDDYTNNVVWVYRQQLGLDPTSSDIDGDVWRALGQDA